MSVNINDVFFRRAHFSRPYRLCSRAPAKPRCKFIPPHCPYTKCAQQKLMSCQTLGRWPWATLDVVLHQQRIVNSSVIRPGTEFLLRCPQTIRQRPALYVGCHCRRIETLAASGMDSECGPAISFDHFVSLTWNQASTLIRTRAADDFAAMRHNEALDTSVLISKPFADE